ncbi:hypothetical protein [Enterobacter kobei]|nr:hypothetical protein [Enterobacter kobei]
MKKKSRSLDGGKTLAKKLGKMLKIRIGKKVEKLSENPAWWPGDCQ